MSREFNISPDLKDGSNWGRCYRLMVLLTIVVVIVAACRGGEIQPAEAEITDSAGVVAVLNAAPADTDPQWSIAAPPLVTIGSANATAPYVLSQVSGAAILPNQARIVVADGATEELRFYEWDGRHINTVGGRGGGPDEFMELQLAGRFDSDSLLAVDTRQRRAVVYDAEGNRRRAFGFAEELLWPAPAGLLSGGRMVADPLPTSDSPGPANQAGEGVQRRALELKIADSEGDLSAVMGPFPGDESFREKSGASGKVLFGRQLHVAARGNRIALGNNDAFRIRVYDDSARLLHIIVQTRSHEEITNEHVEDAIQAAISVHIDPGFRQRMRASLQRAPRPSSLPAYASVHVDATHHVWVREFRRPSSNQTVWQVFGPDGRLKARVTSPAAMELLDVGHENLLGLLRDASGVEMVQLYALVRDPPG